jgi:hypothetical protein
MAKRQGFVLEKSRRRDPRAFDYNTYMVIDPSSNAVVRSGFESGYGLTLDDVEVILSDAEGFDVYFEDPLGDYRDTEAHVLEWKESYYFGGGATRGWLVTTRSDSPQDWFMMYGRNELARAVIEARKVLLEWAADDAEEGN